MLARRAIADELMDDPTLDAEVYAQVVRDLARVNTVTLARRPTLAFLARLAARRTGLLRILDVGFGDGDMLRAIARWARRHQIPVRLVGVDLNPHSAPTATRRTPAADSIEYRTGDYADAAGQAWDAVVSSLVAHHMTQAELVAFLRFMEREAQSGWFINDLERSTLAWLGYPLLARLFGWHPIVRNDGRLSIARSYRAAEWPSLLDEADVSDAQVRRTFPFRLCVERLR